MTLLAGGSQAGAARAVSVEAVAWVAAVAAFLALRVGVTWQAPVGGSEWASISGAWNASIGVEDSRYIPTLFQGLSALLFETTSSVVPARVMAFVATGTIPLAMYLLRPYLGTATALVALLLLAFDAPAIWLGVAASLSAFDVAISLWLVVAFARPLPDWTWAIAAFLVATAGPLPLVPAIAFAGYASWRRSPVARIPLIYGAAGALFGIALASIGFGQGLQGVVVPPVDVLSAWFTEEWSAPSAGELLLLYSWPVMVTGLAGAVLHVLRPAAAAEGEPAFPGWLLAWFAASLVLLALAIAAQSEAPVVAATLPAAIFAAFAIVRWLTALAAVRSPIPWLLAGASLFLVTLVGAVVIDWAREDTLGPPGEQFYVGMLLVAAAILAGGAFRFAAAPVAVLPLVLLALVPWVAGSVNVGLSGVAEPLPAPVTAPEGPAIRHRALAAADETGGPIVVHPDAVDEVTWPFRESGELTVATRVPPDAAFVIWPATMSPPSGVVPVEADWALSRAVEAPTGSLLEYIRWFIDRNQVDISQGSIAVYMQVDE